MDPNLSKAARRALQKKGQTCSNVVHPRLTARWLNYASKCKPNAELVEQQLVPYEDKHTNSMYIYIYMHLYKVLCAYIYIYLHTHTCVYTAKHKCMYADIPKNGACMLRLWGRLRPGVKDLVTEAVRLT